MKRMFVVLAAIAGLGFHEFGEGGGYAHEGTDGAACGRLQLDRLLYRSQRRRQLGTSGQ